MAEEKRNQAAETAAEVNLSDVIRVRHEKLTALREAGADPLHVAQAVADVIAFAISLPIGIAVVREMRRQQEENT